MWEQGVILEQQSNSALRRRYMQILIGDNVIVDDDLALLHLF